MSAKIISLINMKGGVGKTTFTANLGDSLASYKNKRVLLIDLDPQFNLTQYYVSVDDYRNRFESGGKFLKDIFNYNGEYFSLIEGVIEEEEIALNDLKIELRSYEDGGKLDLLPSDLNLANIPENCEYKLKNFLDKIKDNYDFILIDCPPTISKFTKLAFIASDYYIVPTKKEHFGIIGLDLLSRRIKDFENLYSKRIEYLGLAFVSVNSSKRKINKNIDDKLEELDEIIFINKLSENKNFSLAGERNKSIIEFTTDTRIRNQLFRLTDEILSKLI